MPGENNQSDENNQNTENMGDNNGIHPLIIVGIVFLLIFMLGGAYWYSNKTNDISSSGSSIPFFGSSVPSSGSSVPSSGSSVPIVVPPAGTVISTCTMTQELVNGKCLVKCSDGQERVGETCLIKCADGKIRSGVTCINDPNAIARKFPIPSLGAYEFGGMYGYGSDVSGGYPNPLADGKFACPSNEYTANKILDLTGVDNPLYYCAKKIKDPTTWKPTKGSAEFGGMFTGNEVYKNPFAEDKADCPAGFTKKQVLGTYKYDHGLHYCYKEIDDPDTWEPDALVNREFGGMYGVMPGFNTNIATGQPSCPVGFGQTTLYDTNGKDGWKGDYAFTYCTNPR